MTDHKLQSVSRTSERYLHFLFLSIICVLVLWPITVVWQSADGRSHPAAVLIYQLTSVAQMVLGIVSAAEWRTVRRWLTGLAILWFISTLSIFIFPLARWPLLVSYFIIALFQFSLAGWLGLFIFRAEKITSGILLAASGVYLLIGSIFMPIYDAIETITFLRTGGHHAFADGVTQVGQVLPWQTLLYYSVSVLTTVGFGDVVPVAAWARAATMLQALMGVLYLTFIVARLVSLFSASDSQ